MSGAPIVVTDAEAILAAIKLVRERDTLRAERDAALARAESLDDVKAERDRLAADNERLREWKRGVEALFAGGPDTVCRTTTRYVRFPGYSLETECVEVPMDELHAALADTADPCVHRLTEYGTTDCPVERVRAEVDSDGECSACGAPVRPGRPGGRQ